MRFSRTKLIAVIFGALGLLAAACGSSDDSGSSGDGPDKIKLTLQWVTQAQFAGYHAALDQGYYADENLDVTIQPGGPDINPIQLLISGDSDIVIQPFGVVLTSREAGADVVSMGQVFERGAYLSISMIWISEEYRIGPERPLGFGAVLNLRFQPRSVSSE